MAVTIHMYSHFPEHLLNDKFVGLGSETAIKCSLHTSSYTPSQDNDDFWDDADNEVAATGNYTHEGAALTTTTISTSARVMTFDAADTQWTTSTITARYGVIYDSTEAADGDKPLICYIDFGENKISENGTFKLQYNASGIFTITVAAG